MSIISMDEVHFPILQANVDNIEDIFGGEINLYSKELQDGLCEYPTEKKKIKLLCTGMLLDSESYTLAGGHVIFGVGKDNQQIANQNRFLFTHLKSITINYNYLYSSLPAGVVRKIFTNISDTLDIKKSVETFTIIYTLNETLSREVTLYDIDNSNNVLTVLDINYKKG